MYYVGHKTLKFPSATHNDGLLSVWIQFLKKINFSDTQCVYVMVWYPTLTMALWHK